MKDMLKGWTLLASRCLMCFVVEESVDHLFVCVNGSLLYDICHYRWWWLVGRNLKPQKMCCWLGEEG